MYPSTAITPDTNCYYITSGEGTYTAFDVTVQSSEKLQYLYHTNNAWDVSEFDTYKYGYEHSKFELLDALNQTAYRKPVTGIPESDLANEVIDKLEKHFKGWWNSIETLSEDITATDGDYAYIPDAAPATTASIYAYDSTAPSTNYWADTGKKADTSNVQTFASSQEVNEVHLINDCTTGGVNDVLTAEQGKELNNKFYETIIPQSDTAYRLAHGGANNTLKDFTITNIRYIKISKNDVIRCSVNSQSAIIMRFLFCEFLPSKGISYSIIGGSDSSLSETNTYVCLNDGYYCIVYTNNTEPSISLQVTREKYDTSTEIDCKFEIVDSEIYDVNDLSDFSTTPVLRIDSDNEKFITGNNSTSVKYCKVLKGDIVVYDISNTFNNDTSNKFLISAFSNEIPANNVSCIYLKGDLYNRHINGEYECLNDGFFAIGYSEGGTLTMSVKRKVVKFSSKQEFDNNFVNRQSNAVTELLEAKTLLYGTDGISSTNTVWATKYFKVSQGDIVDYEISIVAGDDTPSGNIAKGIICLFSENLPTDEESASYIEGSTTSTSESGTYTCPKDGWFLISYSSKQKISGVYYDNVLTSEITLKNYKYTTTEELDSVRRRILPLYGKKIVMLGDSITQLPYTTGAVEGTGNGIVEFVSEITGATVIRGAIGGSHLARRTTSGAAQKFDVVSIVQAIASSDFTEQTEYKDNLADASARVIAQQLIDMDWDTVDAITIFAGTNDCNSDVVIGNADSTTITEFNGAINKIVSSLLTAYPHLTLFFFTPIVKMKEVGGVDVFSDVWENTLGKKLTDYCNAIESRCENHLVPCCDLYHEMGWNPYNFWTYFPNNPKDGTHPKKGFKALGNKFANFLISNWNR